MREIRTSGSEGGGAELNRLSLPLSQFVLAFPRRLGGSSIFRRVRCADLFILPVVSA